MSETSFKKKSACPAEDMIHVNGGREKKDLNQIYVGQVAMLAFLQSLKEATVI